MLPDESAKLGRVVDVDHFKVFHDRGLQPAQQIVRRTDTVPCLVSHRRAADNGRAGGVEPCQDAGRDAVVSRVDHRRYD